MKRRLLRTTTQTLTHAVILAASISLALMPSSGRAGSADLDSDGIPNVVDPDIDNDGIPNAMDRNVDGGVAKTGPHTGRYIGDRLDNDNPAEKDIDGDSLADDSLGEKDTDGDSKRNDDTVEKDIDGDKRDDDASTEKDLDGDGLDDDSPEEDDIDGDGLDDDDDSETDIDGDGISDDSDDDVDGDGRRNSDSTENDTDGDGRRNGDATEHNDDGDSRRDREDDDDDNDGNFDEDDLDHHQENDELEVQVSLKAEPTAPKEGRARVKIQRMATGKIELEVDAGDIQVGEYEVIVNDVVLGNLLITGDDKSSKGEQEFETNPNKAGELPLPFDPAGLPISLRRGGVVIYKGTVPMTPPLDPGNTATQIGVGETVLARTTDTPVGARAEASVEFGPVGATELEVEVHQLPIGNYQILVGEAVRGTLKVDAALTQGTSLKFKIQPNTPDDLLLDFPVGGAPIAIVGAGVTYFFGTLPASPTLVVTPGTPEADDNGGGTPVVGMLAAGAGLTAEASGKVQVQFGVAGVVSFEVEVEAIPVGAYDLVVAGIVRGVIVVADSGQGLRGKVRFEAVPNSPDELPLDFIPSGQLITITQGGIVFFSGTTPTQG